MEIECQSRSVELNNQTILRFCPVQKCIIFIFFLLIFVGCGRKESKSDSDKSEPVDKDSQIRWNFESGNKPIDSTELDHLSHTAAEEVVVLQWPLDAVLNYGEADVFHEIRGKNGNMPTDSNERLYAANHYQPPKGLLNPIKAPNGHHVILSEWQTAKGTLMVHCNGLTSIVELALEGMIPNGVYTAWVGYLNKPKKTGDPLNFGEDFVNLVNPPLGDANGADNVLIADIDGNIDATIEHPSCILAGAVAIGIPILYHINGKTYGGGVIPDREEVTHLIFYFQ